MKRFNTFEGVFTPTLLSILGVIMYLRLGWVVGQVGLGLAISIIVLANTITLFTALSMSSIVTNIRIGAGGAYSIISKSLGIEAGGAVGIPLYLSQAISVAFYITGFSECWVSVFPVHNILAVSLIVWAFVFAVSYFSARLAFRLQYVIMVIIGLSLVSIFFSSKTMMGMSLSSEVILEGNFWLVFAIFFPAVTGILAGASMSGELNKPETSIPKGTLSAIAVSLCIYIALAVWLSYHASSERLINNTSILIDLGRWKWLVVGGVMGATLSSALSMLVGSPRTLFALSRHSVIPFSESFSRINKRGEPVAAILFTAFLVLVTLLNSTLDSVAGLLTMFFLVTYCMINLSVFIEQLIGVVSFRPSFKVPRIIPLAGGVGCLAVMFLINIKFSIVALLSIVLIYIFLLNREMKIHSPNIRSGFLIFLSENFAKAAKHLPYYPKIWKPNLLVPVKKEEDLLMLIPFIEAVVWPSGRVLFFGVVDKGQQQTLIEQARKDLISRVEPLETKGVFVETSVVESQDIYSGNIVLMQALKNMCFPPNTLFWQLSDESCKDVETLDLINKAESEGLGVIVLKRHNEHGFLQEKSINLWIRQGSPNIDLAILIALQLKNNWDGEVRILQAVRGEDEVNDARGYLERLKKIMRLPSEIEVQILCGDFKEVLLNAPKADINIFGMAEEPDLASVREVHGLIQTSVLFLRDSKRESAFA